MTHDEWVSMRISEVVLECREKMIGVTGVLSMRPEPILADKERTALELMRHEIGLLLSIDDKRKVA
jgi:hypothetical protein